MKYSVYIVNLDTDDAMFVKSFSSEKSAKAYIKRHGGTPPDGNSVYIVQKEENV